MLGIAVDGVGSRLRVRRRTGRDHAGWTRRRGRSSVYARGVDDDDLDTPNVAAFGPDGDALRDVLGRGRSARDRADRSGRRDGAVDDRGAELSERLPGDAGRVGARRRGGEGRSAWCACRSSQDGSAGAARGRRRAPRHRRRRHLARGRRQLLGHALPARRPRADRARRHGRRPWSTTISRRTSTRRRTSRGSARRSIAPSSRTSADGSCRSRTSAWPATRSTIRRCRDGSLHRPQRDRDRRRPGDRPRHRRGVPRGGSARVRRRHPRRRIGADARRDRSRPRVDAPGRPVRLRRGEGDGDRGHRALGDGRTRS